MEVGGAVGEAGDEVEEAALYLAPGARSRDACPSD